MKLAEITNYLESIAPLNYQEDYDNSGLIVGDPNMDIRAALVALDCIEAIVDEAISTGCNLIITHHPIIFKGLKKLNGKTYIERVVLKAIKNNIAVECLPGATAFVPALVNSGLPADAFTFEGFLPVKKGRQTKFKKLAEEERTIILYESPHRLLKTLEEFAQYLGEDRQASVSRELTKMFEETVRGTLVEIKSHFENNTLKGEFVICIAGKPVTKSKNKYEDAE